MAIAKTEDAEPRWLVVKTPLSGMGRFLDQTESREIPTYYPTVTEHKRFAHMRNPIPVEYPAFPGYIFMEKSAYEERGGDIHFSGTKQQLLSANGAHLTVVQAEIDRLKVAESEWKESGIADKSMNKYRSGDVLIVTAGVFAGRKAVVSPGMIHSKGLGHIKVLCEGHIMKIPAFLLKSASK